MAVYEFKVPKHMRNERNWKLDHISDPEIKRVAAMAMEILEEFKPRLYHVSLNDSVYIRFGHDMNAGSLRIADHGNIPKYKYKWNVVVGGENKIEGNRRFYDGDSLNLLKSDFLSLE